MNIAEIIKGIVLCAIGAFTFYIISIYLDAVARSRVSKVIAGLGLAVSLGALIVLVKPNHYLFLSPSWAVVTIAFLASFLFGIYRGLLLAYRGLKMRGLRYSILASDGFVEVLLEGLSKGDIIGVEEGFVRLFRRMRVGYDGRVIPAFSVNYDFLRSVSYEVRKGPGGVIVKARAPPHFTSGFYVGLEGIVLARCLRVRIKGNNLYLCPPLKPLSYAVTVAGNTLSVESSDGRESATAAIRITNGKLTIALTAILSSYKVELYIRRFNRVLNVVHDEKLFEAERGGTYTIEWKPHVVTRWIAFSGDEMPFEKFVTAEKRELRVVSDLTSNVNEAFLRLVLRKGPWKVERSLPVYVKPIQHRGVRVPIE